MKTSLMGNVRLGAVAGALQAAGCATNMAAAQDGPMQADDSAASTGGNATDPATGREFFLEYPCDIAEGEDLTFVLNIHGAGSRSGWQRQYFPASDYVGKYRLIVATPTAQTAEPIRRWTAEADDEHLRNISELVFDNFGRENIRAFWWPDIRRAGPRPTGSSAMTISATRSTVC